MALVYVSLRWRWWSKPFWIPFWLVGEFTTQFRTGIFSGEWDVHWGLRDFDPWPYVLGCIGNVRQCASLRVIWIFAQIAGRVATQCLPSDVEVTRFTIFPNQSGQHD